MKKLFCSLPFQLILGVIFGVLIGLNGNTAIMNLIVTIKFTLGQFINFCVPLIILGFIASSITKLGERASHILGLALLLAYLSSVGASIFSVCSGYAIIPNLSIADHAASLKKLPDVLFQLEIPPVMNVMSALALSIILGLLASLAHAKTITILFDEFQTIVLKLVEKAVIPILPFFIGTTFSELAYEGAITKQLPVFIQVVLLVIIGHFIWLTLLYFIASIYSGKNPFDVIRYYGPAYLTAVGTMSSAATLAVALECAGKSKVLRKDMIAFGIPLFANVHLCGSVLTETFYVMAVSQILYGTLPEFNTMILFCLLLGVFAIGAPGVPGGTVMASLGLLTGILGFDATGTAFMLTVFALQDSFGTACNITGDGALILILSGYMERHNEKAAK